MPLQSTSGAASYDAFGGGAAAKVNYIEDFFQSYLRTGTGASDTVTTGLDGSTKETLVWTKSRSAATNHKLTDNVRGATKALSSNTTGAEATDSQGLTAFSATGYTLGTNTDYNNSGATYVDWQWIAQPKFFDVVTYTGNGGTQQNIPHNLGSSPNCIIVKRTDAAGDWYVAPMMLSNWNNDYLVLNSTAAKVSSSDIWQGTSSKSSTTFGVLDGSTVNISGATYVAYLFAHNAGGFGLTGTDNVISCGSFTGSINGFVDLGFEPQWVLVKKSSGVEDWQLFDNMRGMTMGDDSMLNPNTSGAENNSSGNNYLNPQPTGFTQIGFGSGTFIYIAIRRGPMKVPTSGTSVFNTMLVTGNGTNERQITGVGFPPDLLIGKRRSSALLPFWFDKLRGKERYLDSSSTSAETALAAGNEGLMLQDGFVIDNNYGSLNVNGSTYADWVMRRAPSFFDEVCYTGTGVDLTVNHNLGVVPEWVIIKNRSRAGTNWSGAYFANPSEYYDLRINQDIGRSLITMGPLGPTLISNSATTFGVYGGSTLVNYSGDTYVAYLFATCAGVSKVGSYTGTATTKQIDCGFTGGARFVLIKRTDSTGDWYVWDTARGIVSGNDPYLLLNTSTNEVTSTDYIDTYSAGFELSSTAPAAINASGGTFVFLAIA